MATVRIEAGVFGLVDFTHASCTERCQDLIRTQLGAGIEGHRPPSGDENSPVQVEKSMGE